MARAEVQHTDSSTRPGLDEYRLGLRALLEMSQEGLKFRVRGLRGFERVRDVGLMLVGWSWKIQTRHTRSWLILYYSDITTLLVIGVRVLMNSPIIYVRLVPTKMSLYIHSCWAMFRDGTRESSSWAPVTVMRTVC